MKSPRRPFVETIRAIMVEARERIAAEVFDLATVREAMSAAAGAGRGMVIIRPPDPIDLRATAPAAALIKFIEDSGARAIWSSYHGTDAQGTVHTGWSLAIEWPEAAL